MPSGSRFLLLTHGEDRYADFLNCSNRSRQPVAIWTILTSAQHLEQ